MSMPTGAMGNAIHKKDAAASSARQKGNTINDTLKERESRYGSFAAFSVICQDIKKVLHAAPKWAGLSDSQKEALEMDAHKTARILNGDPDYADNWHDKAGYSTLVENEINGKATR